jgi:hypothetical protein
MPAVSKLSTSGTSFSSGISSPPRTSTVPAWDASSAGTASDWTATENASVAAVYSASESSSSVSSYTAFELEPAP